MFWHTPLILQDVHLFLISHLILSYELSTYYWIVLWVFFNECFAHGHKYILFFIRFLLEFVLIDAFLMLLLVGATPKVFRNWMQTLTHEKHVLYPWNRIRVLSLMLFFFQGGGWSSYHNDYKMMIFPFQCSFEHINV